MSQDAPKIESPEELVARENRIREEERRLREEERNWEQFKRLDDDLLKRNLSNNENFDRAILTLASAALAVSVTFINGLAGITLPILVVVCWAAFSTSIAFILYSYPYSQKSLEKQRDINRDVILWKNEGERNPYSKIHEKLVVWGCRFFFIGVVFLVLFFWANVSNRKGAEDVAKQHKPIDAAAHTPPVQRIQEGASTPKPQIVERAATAPAVQSLTKPAGQPATNANNTPPAEKK